MRIIEKLRAKPYQARLKILWILVTITAVIILGIWFFTLRYRDVKDSEKPLGFREIWNNVKKVYEEVKQSKSGQ